MIRDGTVISCARTIEFNSVFPDTIIQATRFMLQTGQGRLSNQSTENNNTRGNFNYEDVSMVFHGLTITHMDSLAHWMWEDYIYNGYPSSVVTVSQGATKGAITALQTGLFTRAVLIDIPLLLNIPYPQPLDFEIHPALLDKALEKFNISIEPGNVVLLRTGFWRYNLDHGIVDPRKGSPGLYPSATIWLHQHNVSLLGTDTPGDRMPALYRHMKMPTHTIGIVGMGMWILDNADFEALSKECFKRKQWEFALLLSPLMMEGATGSPTTPLVMF